MREGWKQIKLGEVCKINKKNIDKDFKYDYISYLDISSVGSGNVQYNNLVSLEEAPSRAKRIPYIEDTIIATVRPGNKTYSYLKNFPENTVISTGFAVLTPIKDKIDSRYLYYTISEDSFTSYLVSVEKGANYPAVSAKDISDAKVTIPPLKTQRKIASILSAYDDLIENNLKRIKLLEEQAQQTYEEWFVRFKFPGYEDVEFDAVSGLPVGWEKKKIGDVIEVGRGSSPRPISNQKYFEGGTIPWLKIADATSSHIYIYETKLYVNEYGASFSRKLPKGSIVVAASGTLGFPMILGVEACIHDGWLYFKGIDEKLKEYFYFSFIGLRAYFESISYGAAIQNINTGIVSQSPFIVPCEDISIKFKTFVSKIFVSISNLQNQNQLLNEARDILLPRLMIGMIDVDKMEVRNIKLEVEKGLGMVAEEKTEYKIKL